MPTMSTTAGRHDLVDVGPATPAPSWCLPDTEPDRGPVVWAHVLDGVWISCEDEVIDGRVWRSSPRIFGTEEPCSGWTAVQARELARQLVAAADLIDQAG